MDRDGLSRQNDRSCKIKINEKKIDKKPKNESFASWIWFKFSGVKLT